jgi:hypothetical protein
MSSPTPHSGTKSGHFLLLHQVQGLASPLHSLGDLDLFLTSVSLSLPVTMSPCARWEDCSKVSIVCVPCPSPPNNLLGSPEPPKVLCYFQTLYHSEFTPHTWLYLICLIQKGSIERQRSRFEPPIHHHGPAETPRPTSSFQKWRQGGHDSACL